MNTQQDEPKVAHTTGPWTVDFEKMYCGEGTPDRPLAKAIRAGRRIVCAVLCKWRQEDPQAAADARLISAAPELLAALTEAYDLLEESHVRATHNIEMARFRAAIAKATGN